MKRFCRTIAGKVITFAMCILCLAVMAGSVVGIGFLVNYGIYDTNKEETRESLFRGQFHQQVHSIQYHFLEEENRFGFQHTGFEYDATNLFFWIEDAEGNLAGHNLNGEEEYYQDLDYDFSYGFQIIKDTEGEGYYIEDWVDVEPGMENAYMVYAYVDENLSIDDIYVWINRMFELGWAVKYWIIAIALLTGILAIVFFIILMCNAGKRPNDDEIHPGLLNQVPTDVLLLGTVILYCLAVVLTEDIFWAEPLTWTVAIVLGVHLVPGLAMGIATRLKLKTFFTNSLIFMICKLVWFVLKKIGGFLKKSWRKSKELFRNINALWRWVLIIVGISMIEVLFLIYNAYEIDNILWFWFIEKLILVPVILYAILSLYKLKKGGEALAKGDLNYKVNTEKMLWDLKCHGENLNSIADGMSIAVEERLQSERMKSELITNVSHDIKTPLTSIINYARLIGDEPCNSEKHIEFAEVLVRKSEQLKRLLEDLVEISKANSGNLDVNLEKCEAGVLMTQVAGEFEHRCKERNLELITRQPEQPLYIMADSRRVWRVFENLMNNACKYSLPNSRVYMNLEERNGEAVFVFRNTSAAALNITPKELMERFVRGEESRTTEGNGLGLSIASSLTELQGGKMDITIDGDLFKVVVRFSIIGK